MATLGRNQVTFTTTTTSFFIHISFKIIILYEQGNNSGKTNFGKIITTNFGRGRQTSVVPHRLRYWSRIGVSKGLVPVSPLVLLGAL
jgi:hypothetical protein